MKTKLKLALLASLIVSFSLFISTFVAQASSEPTITNSSLWQIGSYSNGGDSLVDAENGAVAYKDTTYDDSANSAFAPHLQYGELLDVTERITFYFAIDDFEPTFTYSFSLTDAGYKVFWEEPTFNMYMYANGGDVNTNVTTAISYQNQYVAVQSPLNRVDIDIAETGTTVTFNGVVFAEDPNVTLNSFPSKTAGFTFKMQGRDQYSNGELNMKLRVGGNPSVETASQIFNGNDLSYNFDLDYTKFVKLQSIDENNEATDVPSDYYTFADGQLTLIGKKLLLDSKFNSLSSAKFNAVFLSSNVEIGYTKSNESSATIPTSSYDKTLNNDLVLQAEMGEATSLLSVSGSGITDEDYTVTNNEITLKTDFLNGLPVGLNSFILKSDLENLSVFTVEIQNSDVVVLEQATVDYSVDFSRENLTIGATLNNNLINQILFNGKAYDEVYFDYENIQIVIESSILENLLTETYILSISTDNGDYEVAINLTNNYKFFDDNQLNTSKWQIGPYTNGGDSLVDAENGAVAYKDTTIDTSEYSSYGPHLQYGELLDVTERITFYFSIDDFEPTYTYSFSLTDAGYKVFWEAPTFNMYMYANGGDTATNTTTAISYQNQYVAVQSPLNRVDIDIAETGTTVTFNGVVFAEDTNVTLNSFPSKTAGFTFKMQGRDQYSNGEFNMKFRMGECDPTIETPNKSYSITNGLTENVEFDIDKDYAVFTGIDFVNGENIVPLPIDYYSNVIDDKVIIYADKLNQDSRFDLFGTFNFNVNFTTKVIPISYTTSAKSLSVLLNFNDNGVTENQTLTLLYNEQIDLPTEITKTGYTFDGWYTALENGTKVEDLSAWKGDVEILYAIWIANEYTLTFDVNGGEGTADSIIVTFGEAVGELPTVTKLGSTFVSYKVGEDVLQSTTVWAFAEDKTAVATWTELATHSVIFNSNGGEGDMTNFDIAENTDAKLPTNSFTKTGYEFMGWSSTAEGAVEIADGGNYTISDADVTLYAVWEKLVYQITFIVEGESTVKNFEYGLIPSFGDTTPGKGSTADFDYVFAGFAVTGTTEALTELPKATQNASYTAIFNEQDAIPLSFEDTSYDKANGEDLVASFTANSSTSIISITGSDIESENYTIDFENSTITMSSDYLLGLEVGTITFEITTNLTKLSTLKLTISNTELATYEQSEIAYDASAVTDDLQITFTLNNNLVKEVTFNGVNSDNVYFDEEQGVVVIANSLLKKMPTNDYTLQVVTDNGNVDATIKLTSFEETWSLSDYDKMSLEGNTLTSAGINSTFKESVDLNNGLTTTFKYNNFENSFYDPTINYAETKDSWLGVFITSKDNQNFFSSVGIYIIVRPLVNEGGLSYQLIVPKEDLVNASCAVNGTIEGEFINVLNTIHFMATSQGVTVKINGVDNLLPISAFEGVDLSSMKLHTAFGGRPEDLVCSNVNVTVTANTYSGSDFMSFDGDVTYNAQTKDYTYVSSKTEEAIYLKQKLSTTYANGIFFKFNELPIVTGEDQKVYLEISLSKLFGDTSSEDRLYFWVEIDKDGLVNEGISATEYNYMQYVIKDDCTEFYLNGTYLAKSDYHNKAYFADNAYLTLSIKNDFASTTNFNFNFYYTTMGNATTEYAEYLFNKITATEDLTIKLNMHQNTFVGLKLNNETIAQENYTFDSLTSTLTITSEYLKTLTAGNNIFVIETSGEMVELNIAISDVTSLEVLENATFDSFTKQNSSVKVRINADTVTKVMLDEKQLEFTVENNIFTLLSVNFEDLAVGDYILKVYTSELADGVDLPLTILDSTPPTQTTDTYSYDINSKEALSMNVNIYFGQVSLVTIGDVNYQFELNDGVLTISYNNLKTCLVGNYVYTIKTTYGDLVGKVNISNTAKISLETSAYVFDINSAKDITISVTENQGKFIKVQGHGIISDNYSYENGVITISKEFLATLPNGDFAFIIVYDNDSVLFNLDNNKELILPTTDTNKGCNGQMQSPIIIVLAMFAFACIKKRKVRG